MNKKYCFLLFVILIKIAFKIDAQQVFFPIGEIDSIKIEAIHPDILTVVDIDKESYELKIKESKKRSVLIKDSIYIRNIADSLNSTTTCVMNRIDVRGKLVFYFANGKTAVFYIGYNSIQFNIEFYKLSDYIFNLLYIPFSSKE